MSTYTVAIATYYNNSWHIDSSTESPQMTEKNAIMQGHDFARKGGFPLYTEYINGVKHNYMIEYNGSLEYAFEL